MSLSPRRLRLAPRVFIAAAVCLATAALACSFTTSLDGLSADYGRSDGSVAGQSPPDASKSDATGATGHEGGDGAVPRGDAGESPVPLGPNDVLPFVSAPNGPEGIALIASDLYWVTKADAKVTKIATSQVGAGAGAMPVIISSTAPFDIAYSSSAGRSRLYFSEANNQYWKDDAIPRSFLCNVGANEQIRYLAPSPDGGVFANTYSSDLSTTHLYRDCTPYRNVSAPGPSSGVAVSGTSVFWAAFTPAQVFQASAVSEGDVPVLLYTSPGMLTIQGVAADANAVYVMEDQKRIRRIDLVTRHASTLYESPDFGGGDVAADGSNLYWSETATGVIRRIPLP